MVKQKINNRLSSISFTWNNSIFFICWWKLTSSIDLKIKHNQTTKVRETHLKSKIFNGNCFNTILKAYNFIVILFLRIFVDLKKNLLIKLIWSYRFLCLTNNKSSSSTNISSSLRWGIINEKKVQAVSDKNFLLNLWNNLICREIYL